MAVGLSLNKCIIVHACRSWSESPIKSFNQYKRERERNVRVYNGNQRICRSKFVTKQISRKRYSKSNSQTRIKIMKIECTNK